MASRLVRRTKPPLYRSGENRKLSLIVSDQKKEISALYLPGPSSAAQPLVLNVTLLGFNVVTDVKRGENGGRKLEHDFVVLGFTTKPLTSAPDKSFRSLPVEIKSSTDDAPGAVVAWVSSSDGSILQVAGGWISPQDHHNN